MRQIWTACILLSTAVGAPAVTLGRHSGAALIGQPLDLQVQVMLSPGEDIATQCLQADVFYGDIQVTPNFVQVVPRAAPGELTGIARVVSSLPVNEPIVTLSMRAGCGLPFTRRYVLLADLVSEPAVVAAPAPRAAVPAPAAPVPVPAPAPAPAVADTPAPAPAATQARPPAPVVRERPRAPIRPSKVPVAPRPKTAAAPAPAAPAAAAPAPVPATGATGAAPTAPAGAPRLRLDPPDLSAGTSPNAAPDATAPAAAPAEPSPLEAALSLANEESRRNAERLAALEAEMARFREAQQRDQARVAELSAQLALAQEQRYSNWLVFLLGGLLLVSLAALVALVRRQRRDAAIASDASRAWWNGPDAEGEAPRASRRAPLAPSAPVPLDSVDVDLDVDSTPAPLAPASRRAPTFGTTLPPPDRRDFAPSAMGGSRSVAAEELFDVQQQADFFVSLGEDDQAINVLRNHLAESHEPSPLAYLDLFRLYHRLGRRAEYEGLREEFNTVFNAGAPPFERYADNGRGLDAYESAFGRIQALWPQPRVLDLIERSLFRDAAEGDTEVFDLEAYRELLMLHAIAKDIVQRESATLPPQEFRNTSMQPLKAVSRNAPLTGTGDDPLRRTVPMDLHVIPPASARQSLDVNLEDMEAESQFEASLPEVDVPVEPTAGRSGILRSGESSLIDFEIVDNDPRPEEPRKPRGEDDEEPR